MGCAVETSKPKRRRKGLSTARPYCELSEEAKARARDCWREKGWTWGQWDSEQLTEFFKQELAEEWGIDEAELSWSLGYCQGDGVSFKAVVDIDKVIAHGVPGCEYYSPHAAKLRELWQAVQMLEAVSMVDIDWSFGFDKKNDHARHDAYAYWDSYEGVDEDAQKILDALADTMQDVLNEIYDDACHRLRKIGYSQIEYQDSDECIAEELDANDYLFDEEGEIV
jgi:hypothetical protein